MAGWLHPDDRHEPRVAFAMATSHDLEDAVVLDVRWLSERAEGYVRDSIHVPYGLLRDRAGEIPQDRKVVVHCAGGRRSPVAYAVLRSLGYASIAEHPGGFAAIEREAPGLVIKP